MALMAKQLEIAFSMLTAKNQRNRMIELGAELTADLSCTAHTAIIGGSRDALLDAIRNSRVVVATYPFRNGPAHDRIPVMVSTSARSCADVTPGKKCFAIRSQTRS